MIFTNLSGQNCWKLKSSIERGDWQGTSSLLEKGRDWIIQEMISSGLRGRGGAGFSTGKKWSFMPKDDPRPSYLVVNGDESEPGTFKDRDILLYEPHKVLEGTVIACHAIGAKKAYIYIRGEYFKEQKHLRYALEEAEKENLLNDISIVIHSGAGAYICGEESALLESLEGKKGMPRLKPPFPAQSGLYGCPTTINNIETIAAVPTILKKGASWFANLGLPPHSCGTKIFSLSGHINHPCNIELSLGTSLKEIIEKYGKGVIGGWDNLKAVIPGGSSTPLIPSHLVPDITMDFDCLERHHTALGTGGIIVMNKSVNIVHAIANLSYFYKHESCGKCSPCREGTGWIWRILNRIAEGNGKKGDIELLESVTYSIAGHTICALGDAAAWPVQGLIRHFKDELQKMITSE